MKRRSIRPIPSFDSVDFTDDEDSEEDEDSESASISAIAESPPATTPKKRREDIIKGHEE